MAAERLGRYVLDKRIGAGGMADIFLAHGPSGVCVVKRPHPHLCASADFVRMFLDEASLLAQLHHPGIAQIFDLGQVGGVYYLAMEYVPGFDLMTISLEHERQGELMAADLCARIISDAADALHYAHEARSIAGKPLNIIHRDVSPHNILLSTGALVKLIDFGVARASSATHRTQAGLVKGKYPYMSPEQITGGEIDRRVDVYALGLCLYELLTNVRAIAGDTEVQQIDNARAGKIRPVEQLRPNVPHGLRAIIGKCLQLRPEDRYPTAAALRDDLEFWLKSERLVVGREDLLRLFRVVAAEVAQLGPIPEEPQSAHPTQPLQAVGDDVALGTAPTHPSMKRTAPGQGGPAPEQPDDLRRTQQEIDPLKILAAHGLKPIPLTNRAPVAPLPRTPTVDAPVEEAPDLAKTLPPDAAPPTRLVLQSKPSMPAEPPIVAPARSRAPMIIVLAGLALAAGILSWAAFRPHAGQEVPDAGVIAPLPLVEAPDAGASVVEDPGPAPDADAGALAAAEPEDAGADVAGDPTPIIDRRAAIVPVSCEPAADIYVDGQRYGRAPMDVELTPGTHTFRLVNKELDFVRTRKLALKPGERVPLRIVAAKGTIEIHATPFALMKVDGKEIANNVSYKAVEVWDGPHTVELSLQDGANTRRKRVAVLVKGGDTQKVEVNFLGP